MSVIDQVLFRYGLRWEMAPYRIVVNSHPHLIVQAGPHFDLRAWMLKGSQRSGVSNGTQAQATGD